MSLQSEPIDFNGTPCIRLRAADGARAIVALHGAHLLSWIPADGRERLFLSERARYDAGAAIRGGVPVIFPQFAARGPLPKHGFARTLPWRFAGAGPRATFELTDNAATTAWPHAFAARLHIGLAGESLETTLEIHNRGETGFVFTAALHTYLALGDLDAAALHGLDGCRVRRQRRQAARSVSRPARRFASTARSIASTLRPQGPLELRDGPHRLTISQDGFADTVVWNPGAALAATIGDLGPHGHQRFVCVEAAQVTQPLRLAPGERWSGTQRLG